MYRKHGYHKMPEHRVWRNMIARCCQPKHKDYPQYGGRGITVCPAWLESFENFLADMGRRPDGCSLDRIDNDEGYIPSNVRWATPKQQANNRRRPRIRPDTLKNLRPWQGMGISRRTWYARGFHKLEEVKCDQTGGSQC